MMCERGLDVDHSTVFRWVQRYAPEINRRIRQHLKMSGTSYRVDETYIKVGKSCKYLYRAVDKEGQTIEFMLSAKRDVSAAKRFFKKKMRADHRRLPFSISVDKNAAYPEAFSATQEERIVPKDCKLRRVKYLNNIIEQDHRFIKKKVRASQYFKHFHTAERTLEGIESNGMKRLAATFGSGILLAKYSEISNGRGEQPWTISGSTWVRPPANSALLPATAS
jgi:transposase-like protein